MDRGEIGENQFHFRRHPVVEDHGLDFVIGGRAPAIDGIESDPHGPAGPVDQGTQSVIDGAAVFFQRNDKGDGPLRPFLVGAVEDHGFGPGSPGTGALDQPGRQAEIETRSRR